MAEDRTKDAAMEHWGLPKPGTKLILCRYVKASYQDQFGYEHTGRKAIDPVEVVVVVSKRIGQGVTQRAMCADGNFYSNNYSTWGDGPCARHTWTREETGDRDYDVLVEHGSFSWIGPTVNYAQVMKKLND